MKKPQFTAHRPMIDKDMMGAHGLTFEKRFLQYVQKKDGHWIWRGSRTTRGGTGKQSSGKIRTVGRKYRSAHEASFCMYTGEIPAGHRVLPCKVGDLICVRPEHLTLIPTKQQLEQWERERKLAKEPRLRAMLPAGKPSQRTTQASQPDRSRLSIALEAHKRLAAASGGQEPTPAPASAAEGLLAPLTRSKGKQQETDAALQKLAAKIQARRLR